MRSAHCHREVPMDKQFVVPSTTTSSRLLIWESTSLRGLYSLVVAMVVVLIADENISYSLFGDKLIMNYFADYAPSLAGLMGK